MKRTLIRLGLSALVSAALFGCGGGSDGINGATNTVTVPVNPPTSSSTITPNTATPSLAAVQAWQALTPVVNVNSVSINSPPVVRFTVTDASGNAMVGLGSTNQAASARYPSLANIRFTLAKLVPGTATAPSKWVSYIVTKPSTVAQLADTTGATTDYCTPDRLWCGTYPAVDNEGELIDYGNGTYQYTFLRNIKDAATIVANLGDNALKKKADLGDVSYDKTLTHRLGIQISGSAPGTGTNSSNGAATGIAATPMAMPINIVYDFRPDGGAVTSTRSVVDVTSCNSCHNGKGLAHGAGRKDPNFCVTCHTDQIKYQMSGEATRSSALELNGTTQNTTSVLYGRAIGNFPSFAHKIHMGNELSMTGYNFIPNTTTKIGLQFDKGEWIQDPRNCTKCHNGGAKTDVNMATHTDDGDNWKNKPSRLACGACHDNVDFDAGTITEKTNTTAPFTYAVTAHGDGPMADDSRCTSCHAAADISVYHSATAPTPNNPTTIVGVSTISYDIKSVTVNASGQPVFVFKITKDGSAVTSFNAPTMPTTGKIAVPGTFEAITGFQSGPSFYVAYAVPQDGITAPSDFNTYQSVSLSNLLVASGSPKGGTLTGPDGSGYWTATLTGDTVGQPVATGCALDTVKATAGWCIPKSPIKIPATAKMVTGAMIGTFKQGVFTGVNQTTLAAQYNFTNGSKSKGLILKSPLKKMVAKDSTGVAYTARRVAVDVDKCESCHEQLGTAVEFHSGARNDPTACAICHNTSRTSNGWSANASTFIHGIHAGTAPAVAKAIDASASLAAAVGSAGTGTNAGVGGAGATFAEGKRNVPFSWARSGSFNAAASKYPGVLKRCDNCHVRNAVNFGTTDGAAAVPGMLWSTSATNSVSSAGALTLFNGATETTKMYPRDPINGSSTNNYVTYITADGVKNYGNVFNYVPEGSTVSKYYSSGSTTAIAPAVAGAGGAVIPADPETLVESPMTSACFACHDSSTAKNHMKLNGGVIYGRRGDYVVNGVLENKEACLTCHGLSKPYDSAIVHAK